MLIYLHVPLFMMYLWARPVTRSLLEVSLETPDGLGSNMTTQRINFGVEAMCAALVLTVEAMVVAVMFDIGIAIHCGRSDRQPVEPWV